jgi:Ca2+-transporting ATPase
MAKRFFGQLKDVLVQLLLGASVASFLLGQTVDALVIVGIVIVELALGTIQGCRADRALDSLRTMTAPTATVVRGGEKRVLPAAEVVPGDVLVLESGCMVPGDALFVETHNLGACVRISSEFS